MLTHTEIGRPSQTAVIDRHLVRTFALENDFHPQGVRGQIIKTYTNDLELTLREAQWPWLEERNEHVTQYALTYKTGGDLPDNWPMDDEESETAATTKKQQFAQKLRNHFVSGIKNLVIQEFQFNREKLGQRMVSDTGRIELLSGYAHDFYTFLEVGMRHRLPPGILAKIAPRVVIQDPYLLDQLTADGSPYKHIDPILIAKSLSISPLAYITPLDRYLDLERFVASDPLANADITPKVISHAMFTAAPYEFIGMYRSCLAEAHAHPLYRHTPPQRLRNAILLYRDAYTRYLDEFMGGGNQLGAALTRVNTWRSDPRLSGKLRTCARLEVEEMAQLEAFLSGRSDEPLDRGVISRLIRFNNKLLESEAN